jgi:hypothetical protein
MKRRDILRELFCRGIDDIITDYSVPNDQEKIELLCAVALPVSNSYFSLSRPLVDDLEVRLLYAPLYNNDLEVRLLYAAGSIESCCMKMSSHSVAESLRQKRWIGVDGQNFIMLDAEYDTIRAWLDKVD